MKLGEICEGRCGGCSISIFEFRQKSNVRPNRIFTADRHIVLYHAAHLKPEKVKEVIDKIAEILEFSA